MPTGYTSHLIDHPESTLREFALLCARAMGFCITQRDDSLNVPMVMDEKPGDYYAELLEEARNNLAHVEAMTDAEWSAEDARIRAKLEERERESDAEARRRCEAYRRMLEMVLDWSVPTELEGMKKFMVEQLRDSIKHDAPIGETHPEWRIHKPVSREERLKQLRDDVRSRQESHDGEVARVAERNRYKRLLMESLDECAAISAATGGTTP